MDIKCTNEGVVILKGDVAYKYYNSSAPFHQDSMGDYFNGEMIRNASDIVTPVTVIQTYSLIPKLELYIKTYYDTINNLSLFIKVIDVIKDENESVCFLITESFDGIRLSNIINGESLNLPESSMAIQLRHKQNQNRETFAAKIMEGVIRIVKVLHQNHILLERIDPDDFYITNNLEVKMFYSYDYIFRKQNHGQFCGSNGDTYSSPEVIRGDANGINESSDTYSLGLLLYHLSTGEEPFPENYIEGFHKKLTGRVLVDKIKDKRLRRIVEKSTSKKQDCRYNSTTSMYEDLERLDQPECCETPNTIVSLLLNTFFSPISIIANFASSLFTDHRRNKKESCIKEDIRYDSFSSVFAPAEVKSKSRMMVQVFLHLNEENEKVKALATEADKNAERRDYIPLQTKLKKGDKVDVVLNINGNTLLYNSRKSIIWHGSFCKCAFDYLVPSDLDVDELSSSVTLYVNGAIVGEMLFYTQIVDSPAQLNANVIAKPVKKLFISYSHNDLKAAETIAKLYEGMDVDVFFDKHRLKSGYIYSEEIFNFINKADTFVLCWSENAAQSEYVQKERKAALELAYPNRKPRALAQINIKPYNIQPYATPPEDMIEHYHFEEL